MHALFNECINYAFNECIIIISCVTSWVSGDEVHQMCYGALFREYRGIQIDEKIHTVLQLRMTPKLP